MANELIGIDISGDERVAALLDGLETGSADAGVESANDYLMGGTGLRRYPPRVAHGQGNPYLWQSEKQRRAYFATNGFGGGIPYARTNTLKDGWQRVGTGRSQIVVNEVPYGKYVMGDNEQQRGHRADGWLTMAGFIERRLGQIVRAFDQGISKFLAGLSK